MNHLHGGVVHKHIVGCHLGVLRCHLLNERLPSAPTDCPKQVQGEAHGGSFGAHSLCGFHRPALAAKEP